MTNNTRTPEEIEREIERERAGLTNTLEDLQEKFSVESVARQFTNHLRENGNDIGKSVSESVKSNPIALALTGVGLAWMIFGNGSGASNSQSSNSHASRSDSFGRNRVRDDINSLDRRDDNYRDLSHRADSQQAFNQPSWAMNVDRHTSNDQQSSVASTAANMASSVKDAGKTASNKISESAEAVSNKASSTIQSARNAVDDATARTSDRMAMMREQLSEGTEQFSEEARQKIIDARYRAIEARDAAGQYAKEGRDRAVDLFEDQPLIAGALALAVGAAFAAALPRSRVEDAYIGEQSDAAMAEAERVFHEEKRKLEAVANAAGSEAKKVATQLKSEADKNASEETVAKTVAKKAKQAGKRVSDAAKAEAKQKNLGKPKSN